MADDFERYTQAAHAMQSGVAMMMNYNDSHEPKHLRVGVNSAMIETSALVKLLIDKGLITYEEWAKVLADFMEAEVVSYERQINNVMGNPPTKITLR